MSDAEGLAHTVSDALSFIPRFNDWLSTHMRDVVLPTTDILVKKSQDHGEGLFHYPFWLNTDNYEQARTWMRQILHVGTYATEGLVALKSALDIHQVSGWIGERLLPPRYAPLVDDTVVLYSPTRGVVTRKPSPLSMAASSDSAVPDGSRVKGTRLGHSLLTLIRL